MSSPRRRLGRVQLVVLVIAPILVVAVVLLALLPKVMSHLEGEGDGASREYLDQTNSVLGIADACEALQVADIGELLGIEARPEIVHESSPTEYDQWYVQEHLVSCRLSYEGTTCPPEESGTDRPHSWTQVDVYPNPDGASAENGYEVFLKEYGNDGDLYDLPYRSLDEPWKAGEVFTTSWTPDRAIASIALADFYRVEVTAEIAGDGCGPTAEELAAVLTDEFLPELHGSIEELAASLPGLASLRGASAPGL